MKEHRSVVAVALAVAALCAPWLADAQECFPACRAGYSCQAGTCVAAPAPTPAPAPALAPAPGEPEPPPGEPVRRGLQVQGSVGLSGETGAEYDDARQTGPGLGFELSGWFRPIPLLGLGLGAHYNLLDASDFDRAGVRTSAGYLDLAVGARVHPPIPGPVDAYAGVTLDYAIESYSQEGGGATNDTSVKGAAVGLHVGGEYFLAPSLSAGLLARFVIPFWSTYCTDYEGPLGSIDECRSPDAATEGHADVLSNLFWYVGATFSYHLAL